MELYARPVDILTLLCHEFTVLRIALTDNHVSRFSVANTLKKRKLLFYIILSDSHGD